MSAETAAQLSNDLVYSTMAAYVVAMLALAAEAAFGSRAAARDGRTVAADAAPRAVLVSSPTGIGTGDGVGPTRDGVGPTRDGVGPDDVTGAGVGPEGTSARGGRADRMGRIGMVVFVLGSALLAAGVVARAVAAGRVPWGNMYEFAITGALVVAVAFLLAARWWDLRFVGVWLVGTLLLTLGLAVAVLYVPPGPLVPALRSYWLLIHVLAAIVSAGVFTVSMVLSALHLVAERAARLGRSDQGYVAMLPPAATLEQLAYRVTAFAFPVWTFAVIAGAIWAEASWGRYWGWDPKETWALITWLVYASYLHARSTVGWRGRRASVVALVAYATLIFNFFGVNIFFVGLHSYGGVS